MLYFHSTVAGANSLTLNGPGDLDFGGNFSNTFSGTMTVNEGTVFLDGVPPALAGDIVIGDGIHAAQVTLGFGGQTAATTNVTINTGSTFDLNGNSDTIASLTMTGGTVLTGAGTLT